MVINLQLYDGSEFQFPWANSEPGAVSLFHLVSGYKKSYCLGSLARQVLYLSYLVRADCFVHIYFFMYASGTSWYLLFRFRQVWKSQQ